jgi:2-hydroxychromene-2-carboxylate isomerase
MTDAAPLDFHFDFISPYAYLAWTQIDRIAAAHGRRVNLVPVLFGAMLDSFGTIGPAEIPIKRDYVYLDVHRKAKLLGVPITPPPRHPFAPLPALRAAIAFDDPAERARAVAALYRATWVTGDGVDSDVLVAEALSAAGLDGDAAVARAATPEVKRALLHATNDAITRGVFGVPTVVVDGQSFWGCDSLPTLEQYLRGEDPITDDVRARVKDIPIGIERKRA